MVDLDDHKLPYIQDVEAACPDLLSAVRAAQPTVLIGLTAGVAPPFAFTREVRCVAVRSCLALCPPHPSSCCPSLPLPLPSFSPSHLVPSLSLGSLHDGGFWGRLPPLFLRALFRRAVFAGSSAG